MPLNPKHRPGGDRPAADRQFIDREECTVPFHATLREPPRTSPLVLIYYGVAGIGKSRLRKELVQQLAGDSGVVTATLDFDIPGYRQPETALFVLRKTIHEAWEVKFPSFDLAYAVYWQKTHPDTPLTSGLSGDTIPNRGDSGHVPETQLLLEPGSILPQVLDDAGKVTLVGLIPKIAAVVDKCDKDVQDWWQRRGERELEDLPQMEPGAIIERLPMFWAADLKDYLLPGDTIPNRGDSGHVPGRRAVLFIDSYESLWETGRTESDFFKRDEWVRELVMQLPEVLWVICGRQKLRWEEVDADWGKALSQHQLQALPDSAARRFLEACDITDGQIQDGIVKGSQGVPHYLSLAVDTVQISKVESGISNLQTETPEQMVEEFTRQLEQPEIETLQVLSAPRFWYYGLFENLMTKYQTGYPLTAYDDLSRFSFISEGAAPGTQTMHQLMREALQENQPPELRKRVHLFLHEFYARQLEGLNVKGITEQHRTALIEAFYHGRQAMSAEKLWSWFKAASDVFDDAGQHRLLTPLLREMVQSLEAEFGPNHPTAAGPVYELARQLDEQGEYDEAESLYRRTLSVAEKEHGPEHPPVLDCMSSLGQLLRKRTRLDEAENLCRRVLELLDKAGRSAIKLAEAIDNLGAVMTEKHKYAEAEELFRRSIAICERELGPEDRKTAIKLNNLAYLLWDQQRFAEAESLNRRALAIFEKVLGMDHPDLMLPLDGLGVTLHHLGRYAEAEALHRRALKLCEENLGPDHPDTAVCLNNLGSLLRDQNRLAEAEPLLRRALAVHERKMGPDHPFTINMTNNLVTVLTKQGKSDEAEPIILNAIAAREKKLGPDHPQTAGALYIAGGIYSGKGRYAEAESYLRRALDIRTRVLGPEHTDTMVTLNSMGLLEERRGRHAEAESIYRDLVRKRERVLGPDHPDVAGTTNRLAGICTRDGRYAEAEVLYRRALAIREKVFGPNHPFTAETLEDLAKVCEQTGRTAEAQGLSARAKTIRAQSAQA